MDETRESYQTHSDEAEENSTSSATREPQQPTVATREIVVQRQKCKALLYWFGVAEIVLGSVSILLAIASLIVAPRYTIAYSTYSYPYYYTYYYYHGLTYSSQGIWGGAMIIVTGILGVVTKSKPSVCIYKANMALSITAAIVMVVLMVSSTIATYRYAVWHGYERRIDSLAAIHGIIGAIGIAAMALCIVHSAFCCAGVCCRRPKPYQGPVVYAPQPYGNQQPQQMVQLANGRFIFAPIQPVAAPDYPGASASTTSDIMPVMHQTPQGGVVVPPMNV